MIKGRIHSIETFGVLDGPGTRLVVFVQGCPLRCAFCHNPDTWNAAAGSKMSVAEILSLYQKNREFYEGGRGGITVSGGEPLLQLSFVTELFQAAHANPASLGGPIHTCLDTSGFFAVPTKGDENADAEKDLENDIEKLLQYTDLVLLDIKETTEEAHKNLTGRGLSQTLRFLALAHKHRVKVLIRHVVVPGLTDSKEELEGLGKLIAPFENVIGVELLPYHKMGAKKYKELKIPYRLEGVPEQDATKIADLTRIVLKAREKALRS